jgi:hypothetical protein
MSRSIARNLAHLVAILLAMVAIATRSARAQSEIGPPAWKQTAAIDAPEAVQAAAADEKFLYAIANKEIAKYDRKTGQRLALSSGDAHHLNSGFLWGGKLYCAHSNYPRQPEKSELLVLDIESMQLTTLKEFGNFGGSLTWAVREGEHWWCNFARYGQQNGETFLVKFDDAWRELARWTYPAAVTRELGTYSLSGGLFREGDLLVTGHDDRVVFRLRVPTAGMVLEYLDRQRVPFTGQGIAHDPVSGGLVGIQRGKQQIILAMPE